MTTAAVVSVNEIHMTSQKAMEAAAVPWGLDNESAAVITWLEQHELDGIGLLANALESNRVVPAERFEIKEIHANSWRIDAAGCSAITAAGYFLDHLDTLNDGDSAVHIVNCPDLLAACARLALAPRDHPVTVFGNTENQTISCGRVNAGTWRIQWFDRLSDDDGWWLFRHGAAHGAIGCAPNSATQRRECSSQHSTQAISRSVEQGVTPNADAWAIVKNRARGVLVPSTELSRAIGTGGGDANE